MKPEKYTLMATWAGLGGYALFASSSIAMAQIMLGLAVAGFIGYFITVADRSKLVYPPALVMILIAAFVGFRLVSMVVRGTDIFMIREDWLFLLAIIGAIMFRDIKRLTAVLDLFVLGVLAIGGYGIWQHFVGVDLYHQVMLDKMTYGYRSIGTFSIYLTFSGFFAVTAIFLVPAGFSATSRARKIIYLIASQVSLACILFNYSRSTMVALVVGIVAMVLLIGARYRKWVLLVLLMTLAVGLVISPDFLNRFKNIDKTEFSASYANSRLAIWETAISMIEQEPLLGVGPGNFSAKYKELRANRTGKNLAHAHNDILSFAAESGIISSILFVLLWIVMFWRLYKGYVNCPEGFQKGLIFGALLVSVVFIVMSQVEAFFADEEVRMLLMFCWGIGLAVIGNMKASERLSEIA